MESKQLAEVASDTTHPGESWEFQQVEAALRAGFGWGHVAELLGVSRQAVHKKYSNRIDPTIDVPRRRRG